MKSESFIDRKGGIPLYIQLADILQSQITSSEYQPNSLFPGEEELIKKFGVSRNTVRKAQDVLVDKGLIIKKAGKGTFVTSLRVLDKNRTLDNLSDSINAMGLKAGITLLNREEEIAPEHVTSAFSLQKDSRLLHVKYITTSNEIPFGFSDIWLNNIAVPELAEVDFSQCSQFELIEKATGKKILRGVRSMTADLASHDEETLLEIPHPSAVFRMDLTIYITSNSVGGTPIEFLKAYWRANETVFEEELYRTD
jgi:GntR family transcriptional regulator